MRFLVLYFVILIFSTTTNTHIVLEHADSSYSKAQITVPYTLWVGTHVIVQINMDVSAPEYTSFYDLMKLAEEQSPEYYR